jgi:hypothetical protein
MAHKLPPPRPRPFPPPSHWRESARWRGGERGGNRALARGGGGGGTYPPKNAVVIGVSGVNQVGGAPGGRAERSAPPLPPPPPPGQLGSRLAAIEWSSVLALSPGTTLTLTLSLSRVLRDIASTRCEGGLARDCFIRGAAGPV